MKILTLLIVENPIIPQFYGTWVSIFTTIMYAKTRKEESSLEQIKIGKFISAMRKEQNFTQRELAEKLNISDKTVSKWETGD